MPPIFPTTTSTTTNPLLVLDQVSTNTVFSFRCTFISIFYKKFKTIVLESSINDNCSFYPAHPEKFYHPVTYEIMYQVYDKTCMGSQKCCLFFFFLHQFKMKIFQKGKRWFLRKIFSIKIWCRVKWSTFIFKFSNNGGEGGRTYIII